ncbi:MAG TPA: BON domain-containing protein [Chitinophagaceae bacterium]
MAYYNRHQLRSDQVWNRDLRHSDEEDIKPRSLPSAYSPGYSNSRGYYSDPHRERDYREGQYHSGNYPERYSRGYGDRYEDRWQEGRDRFDRSHSADSGSIYDYDSGYMRSYRDYDRGAYNRHYDDRGDSRQGYDHDRNWWDRSKDEVMSWFGDEDAERRREHDRSMSHRGKGPKGYQRSDERIREDISDRLSDDDYVDASDIEIEVNGPEVVLKGTVTTRAEKRRAEDIAESVSGVQNVENRLRCTQPNSAVNMNRYTGTTNNFTGIGNSSGTTSEIMRDVRNNDQHRY